MNNIIQIYRLIVYISFHHACTVDMPDVLLSYVSVV